MEAGWVGMFFAVLLVAGTITVVEIFHAHDECRLDLFIGRSRRPIVKYLLININILIPFQFYHF